MISINSTVVAVDNLVYTDLGDEVALLHLQKGVYYGLDAVGGHIWNLLQEPRTVSEIYEIILAEYQVEAKVCQEDLFALLNQLADESLIMIQESNDEVTT